MQAHRRRLDSGGLYACTTRRHLRAVGNRRRRVLMHQLGRCGVLVFLGACLAKQRDHARQPTSPRLVVPAAMVEPSSNVAGRAKSADGGEASSVAEAPAPGAIEQASCSIHEEVCLTVGPTGHLGAVLALGPFRLGTKETPEVLGAPGFQPKSRSGEVFDDRRLVPRHDEAPMALLEAQGGPKARYGRYGGGAAEEVKKARAPSQARWLLLHDGQGPIDLEAAFDTSGRPAIAYVGGTLRLASPMRLVFALGVDDGVELRVDGSRVYVRDVSRPRRDDDDLVTVSLGAGDHDVVLKLHQHDAGWGLRLRVLDEALRPAWGVRWLLRGLPVAETDGLFASLASVRFEREPTVDGWLLRAVVQAPQGVPWGRLPLRAEVYKTGTPHAMDAMDALVHEDLGQVSAETLARGPWASTLATPSSAPWLGVEQADGDYSLRVDLGRRVAEGHFAARKVVHQAVLRGRSLLERWRTQGRPVTLPDDVEATVRYLTERLESLVRRGDSDVVSQVEEAKPLLAFVGEAEARRDPIAGGVGVMRLAHFARADGAPQPMGVYLPAGLSTLGEGKKLPLYVGLHGMDGGVMAMLRVFFGGDRPKVSMAVLDRGQAEAAPLRGVVLAPHGHGNAMYRQLGEEEVMDAIGWALARFPQIDVDRIYVTGFSMGGIGAAAIPFHHPDVFAAAEPLCGYHSMFVRRDVIGKRLRPWERFLLEDRSNVFWAENGARLPLHIVAGQQDLPVENSGVLVDRYDELRGKRGSGFPLDHEEPDLGHDVWGYAYDHLAQVKWFDGRKRASHPKTLHFRTSRPRFGRDAWLQVVRTTASDAWAEVDAKVSAPSPPSSPERPSVLRLTTSNVQQLQLDLDPVVFGTGALHVDWNGAAWDFDGSERTVSLDAPGDKSTSSAHDKVLKAGPIAGPIRDVWHEPLVFVVGTSDPTQTEANWAVARALSTLRWGVDVSYPIVRDVDVPVGQPVQKSMVVIGNAKSNVVTRALEPQLPFQVVAAEVHCETPRDAQLAPICREVSGKILGGGHTWEGRELGAMFVRPHPWDTSAVPTSGSAARLAPRHYLLVVEGADALGTLRALSLPEQLPDFVVWDEGIAQARGQQVLGTASALAAGFFDASWSLPSTLDDPWRHLSSRGARSEREATSYLP